MRIYVIGLVVFGALFTANAIWQVIGWSGIKESYNKDSVEERAAARKAKWSVIYALSMLAWPLTVPLLAVYHLTRLLYNIAKSEQKPNNP